MAHAKIDKNLLDDAMAASGLKSKRATVEAAVQLFIQIKDQNKIRDLRGRVQWEGNLEESREGRFADIQINRLPKEIK